VPAADHDHIISYHHRLTLIGQQCAQLFHVKH
jgi:hypothetical protein